MRFAQLWSPFLLAVTSAACNGQQAARSDTGASPSPPVAATQPGGAAFAATLADVARVPDVAQRSASGLAFQVLSAGQGKEHPLPEDRVRVHYVGWTRAGKTFYSSFERGQPTLVRVSDGIAAWQEALPLMVAGERRRIWVPSKLGYGDNAPVAPGDLVFDIELVGIAKPPPVPPDLVAPPKDARVTASGLAYRVLKAGTGSAHPLPASRVTLDYSGWSPDGKMFDSSVARGEPALLRMTELDEVVKGFAEGVALLVVGDTARLWVPAERGKAHGDEVPFAISGPLVFDVELLAID